MQLKCKIKLHEQISYNQNVTERKKCEHQKRRKGDCTLDIFFASLISESRHILYKMLKYYQRFDVVFGTCKDILCMHFVMIVDLAGPRQVEQISKDLMGFSKL